MIVIIETIRAVTITDEQIAMKNEDQLILTDNAIGTPALTETTPDPTPTPDPGKTSGTESTSSETAGPGEETVSFEKQLLADIEAATSGDVVTKTVPDGEVVSRAVLAKAKEKGIRLILESKAGTSVRWAFDRIDTEMDFNPMVKTGVEIKGVKDLLKKASLPDKMKYITVSFAHNGALPGTAKAAPDTGDHAPIGFWCFFGIAGMAAISCTRRKKRETEK